MIFNKTQMETQNKNNSIMLDTFYERQKAFKPLNDKAKECADKDKKIDDMLQECKSIFEMVLKGYSSTRKQLGIYLKREGYGDNEKKKMKDIIIGKENLPEHNGWFYEEICLNDTGFSFLPIQGVKSESIFQSSGTEFMYRLLSLKDKYILAKVKEEVNEDKAELLDKVLNNIEILKYDNDFIKEKEVQYFVFERQNHKLNKIKDKAKRIKIDASGLGVRVLLDKNSQNGWSDLDFHLPEFSTDNGMVLEQIQDDVSECLDEYITYLKQKENEIEQHLKKVKTDFTKELIIMNLTKQDSGIKQ